MIVMSWQQLAKLLGLYKEKLYRLVFLLNNSYIINIFSDRTTAPEIKISLGEYDRCTLDISSVNVSVESIILHPEFNPDSHTHDLALIRLSRPTKFEKRISPVCLPNPGLSGLMIYIIKICNYLKNRIYILYVPQDIYSIS